MFKKQNKNRFHGFVSMICFYKRVTRQPTRAKNPGDSTVGSLAVLGFDVSVPWKFQNTEKDGGFELSITP